MAEAKIQPSRDFMIRQATLDALHSLYPNGILRTGRCAVAWRVYRLVRDQFWEGEVFVASVQERYRILARVYRVAA